MSDHYQPPQRAIALRILTQAGWVTGTLRVPSKSRLTEFLDHAHEFVPMTDVELEGKYDPLPFLALRRSSIQLIIAGEQESTEPVQMRPTVAHRVECLLPNGFVSGDLQVTKSVRLSDQLALRPTFFAVMREAHLRLRDPWSGERIDLRASAVLLNTQAIVGLTELEMNLDAAT